MLHHHLERQLRKLGIEPTRVDDGAWRELLRAISRSYDDADRERYLLERMISESSREMRELNTCLASERDVFARMLQAAPVGIARIALDGTMSVVNPALAAIVGRGVDELEGREALAFVYPARRGKAAGMLKRLIDGDVTDSSGALKLIHADGRPVHTRFGAALIRSEDGRPQYVIIVLEDVSQQSRLEIELRHSQKLESVGRLAAGIAHEINTPIQFVGDNVTFMDEAFEDLLRLCETYQAICLKGTRERLTAEDLEAIAQAEEAADLAYLRESVPESIAATREGARRVAHIVQSMKRFAHPDRGERVPADINAALASTLTVAGNELKYVAQVQTEFGELPHVPCFISDLNQVFLNLLINAAHAIADVVGRSGERGSIRVRTGLDGDHVVISIADTGSGIPEHLRDRVFEPFFTTKAVGKGTGQGLALARSVIVDKHGGSLKFDSQPGQGTTFTIRLPLLQEATGQHWVEGP
jgi:PAS domain S-box-containing protein